MDLKNKDKIQELLLIEDVVSSTKDMVDLIKRADYNYSTYNFLGYNIASIIRYDPSFGEKLKSFLNNIENDIKEQLKDL